MNLAISSLAWRPSEDDEIARLLSSHGFGGIELVPTKLWPDLPSARQADLRDYRRYWNDRGIQIVALQALLFGRDDLTLFGSEAKRDEGVEFFESVFRMARELGARALVYGSPKNRRGVDGQDPQVVETAQRYFRRLGELARKNDVCLCIEPLPSSYPCDFVTNSTEALRFVESVNDRGFGLHLDSASLYLANEDVGAALIAARGRIEHFHLSEPGLSPVHPEGRVPLAQYLNLLAATGYRNWVSIEMREPEPCGSNLEKVAVSLDHICHAASMADQCQ